MDFGDRRAEAQSILKEATKLSAPSFLGMRLKGDWIQATPMFERAALLFRVRFQFRPFRGIFSRLEYSRIICIA